MRTRTFVYGVTGQFDQVEYERQLEHGVDATT